VGCRCVLCYAFSFLVCVVCRRRSLIAGVLEPREGRQGPTQEECGCVEREVSLSLDQFCLVCFGRIRATLSGRMQLDLNMKATLVHFCCLSVLGIHSSCLLYV
jgi:hypothetical protein